MKVYLLTFLLVFSIHAVEKKQTMTFGNPPTSKERKGMEASFQKFFLPLLEQIKKENSIDLLVRLPKHQFANSFDCEIGHSRNLASYSYDRKKELAICFPVGEVIRTLETKKIVHPNFEEKVEYFLRVEDGKDMYISFWYDLKRQKWLLLRLDKTTNPDPAGLKPE